MPIGLRVALAFFLIAMASGAAAIAAAAGPPLGGALAPERRPPTDSPALWGMAYEPVSFESSDGAVLRGWFIPGRSRATVALAHGLWMDRQSMLPIATALHQRAGVSLLLFDFRSVGESGGDRITFGYREQGDLAAAVDYLESRPDVDPQRIGAMGNSLGAAVTLLTAAARPDIAAVAADSPFTSVDSIIENSFQLLTGLPPFPLGLLAVGISEWELGFPPAEVAPLRAVGRISPRPLFLIHGLRDKLIPYSQSEALYDAAGAPKELWLVPGADHVGARTTATAAYEQRVAAFFRRHLHSGR
ncbi:MAG: alpha/beta fold hydrolase [Chloroflexi bacterium]|nr:alpha/beta fold hydrolase [Chloroflexota bacterium]